MGNKGKFKRELSLTALIFLGFGATFGSGWLFTAGKVASMAGPAGIISWLLGGGLTVLLALIYSEMGAAIPSAGGTVRYPAFSHGPLIGYLVSFAAIIAFSSIVGIEAIAARQYATAWWPALSIEGSNNPTILGWIVQFLLILSFFLLNYWSVKSFGKVNTVLTLFKFIVPALTIILLLINLKGENYSVQGFMPGGVKSIGSALAVGGIMWAYLGLQPIVSAAGEAKNPKKNIPIAIIVSMLLATVVYVTLQVAFLGSVPTDVVAKGWSNVNDLFSLPFYDNAMALGLVWLGVLILADSAISPAGLGLVYKNTTARTFYGWSRSGTFFRIFAKIDEKSGIPRPALWLSFAVSVFWTIKFPNWSLLVDVASIALILTFATAPVSFGVFRRSKPNLKRPFYLKGGSIISPIVFVFIGLVTYWSGWDTLSWLLASQIVMFIIYLMCKKAVPKFVSFGQQVKSSWWLIFFYVSIFVFSYLGTFGGIGIIGTPWDQIIVAVLSLISYYWGVSTGLPEPVTEDDDVEDDLEQVTTSQQNTPPIGG